MHRVWKIQLIIAGHMTSDQLEAAKIVLNSMVANYVPQTTCLTVQSFIGK